MCGILLMKSLIPDCDGTIAAWTFSTFDILPHHYEACFGIVENHQIIGSVLWEAYRGHDIEISYFGPKTMTLGIARACARLAMDYFHVSRVTARTSRSNKMMTRGIKKIGFEYEGVAHNGYGDEDAIMYGLYGHKLARLAGKTVH
jgi:RimJ/RimL family protein N-acetyltransferase